MPRIPLYYLKYIEKYHLLTTVLTVCLWGGTTKMRKIWIILAVLIVFALVSTVSAIPIQFDTTCQVTVKYLGGDAGYDNVFGWVEGLPPGTLNYLGTGNDYSNTPIGESWNIGARTAYENNIFYITPAQTGLTYYSDPATANPDSIEHVMVTPIDPTAYLVSVGFEDLLGGGDTDFNDINLEVTCTPIITPPPVPEFPTAALPAALLVGMLGAVLFIQKTKKN
jgi:hypothetical protein